MKRVEDIKIFFALKLKNFYAQDFKMMPLQWNYTIEK